MLHRLLNYRKSGLIAFFGVWLSILALAFVLTACSGDEDNEGPASRPGGNASLPAPSTYSVIPEETRDGLSNATIYFGDFTVAVRKEKENPAYKQVALSYNGESLSDDGDGYRTVIPGGVTLDFPLPDCRTMTLELFTGGANCCFAYYILMNCPDEDLIEFNEPMHGGMGALTRVSGNVSGYPINDPAFMYYSTENQKGDAALSLSGAESPRPTRYIVFADNVWRVDKVGEFAPAYRALPEKLKGKDINPASLAISLAYYSYMAGDDEETVKALLKAELPKEYAPLTEIIFKDVVKAVEEFKPFKRVPLPEKAKQPKAAQ